MTSEPNLLNRITITIEANNQQVARKVLHGSLLNQANINKLFNSYFNEYEINRGVYLETLILNLGTINFHDFNSLFPTLLKAALNKEFSQYQINNHREEMLFNETISNQATDKSYIFGDNKLIDAENFIHFLYQKHSTLNLVEAMGNNGIEKLTNQLTQIENKFALLLAKSCLSEEGLKRLLAIKQPDLLIAINRRLSERINRPQYQEKLVSCGQLIFSALGYIQQYNIQEIPKPDEKVIARITTELNNNGLLNTIPIITLFRQSGINDSSLNDWLKKIWQVRSISQLCRKYLSAKEYQYLSEHFVSKSVDKNRYDEEPVNQSILSRLNNNSIKEGNNHSQLCTLSRLYSEPVVLPEQTILRQVSNTVDQSILSRLNNASIKEGNNQSQLRTLSRLYSEPVALPEQTIPRQVSNTGILILWPMLPTLFNQLGLLEKKKFIHRQAQFNAVDFLDYLIWGTEDVKVERKVLNNVLCGLMADEITEPMPIEPEKQWIIIQWLDAIISQLSGWKKLSRNDVRQLFLQRPGELLINEQEIKITIQQQPFDALLTDWPWPMNMACFSWLSQPLTITWL
ncbi:MULTISPECIES: contractile injection system tape measure protein [Photorhabdus]|uniref:Uncharacterized protein n=2 Tax=Photorhabdus asymbiotica TaxID=291112 RepID=B6VNN1_PHOAA|nr:contractile injection system tape measure protein [Photorhabdus asymbiotica]RKS59296.1 hypothetical protein BDD30_1362 [Photorhabdus asymbiotica]CAQ85428.1 conserved hypothetical protein [Photorhabdus asymbiotica]CAR67762.1 Hypothetical Protein PA-RVA20-21-0158 [Photorhabdus asymbiotica subsp. asymbiotica ATCC 43949]